MQYSGWAIGRMGSRAEKHYHIFDQIEVSIGNVNRAVPFLHGGSLTIMLTDPLNMIRIMFV